MPVPAHVEPNPNLTRMERCSKMVFMYLFDYLLFFWIVPRGVKLTIRLASMVFLKLSALSVTIYIQYALVLTLQANKGLVPQTTLTMSTEQILGLPEDTGCHRVKRTAQSSWEDLIVQMAGDKKMDVPDMEKISIVTEKATSDHALNPLTDDLIGNFNLTVEGLNVQDDIILNSFNLTDVNGTDDHLPQVFNDTLLVSSQTERDSFLIDTAMQIFYDYFQLDKEEKDSQDLSFTFEEATLDDSAKSLLDDLTSMETEAMPNHPEQKGLRCRCNKILSRQDLKILIAALASTLFVTGVIIVAFCCCRNSRASKPERKDTEMVTNL